MATIGVDFGRDYSGSLFNSGASANLGSALSSAFGGTGGLKRDLIASQIAAKQAYIESLGHANRFNDTKSALNDQELAARAGMGDAAAILERNRFGTSNARPSGAAAPAVVDAAALYAKNNQMLATGSSDAAQGLNKLSGGIGMMYGAPSDARRNFTLMGGSPTDNTVLGPADQSGIQGQIAVGNAREAAKAQGDIAVNNAKGALDQQLDPMKNKDSLIYQLETKKFHQGGQLSPEEEAQLQLARRLSQPQTDINYTDAVTGQHVNVPRTGDRIGNIYDSAPIAVQPTLTPFAPPPARAPTGAAPAIVGGSPTAQNNLPPGATAYGNAKQPPGPTENDLKMELTRSQMIGAEKFLTKVQPGQTGDFFATLATMNPDAKYNAQQFLAQFSSPEQRRFARMALEFVEPVLRWKSGAALAASEWAGAFMQFVPPPNATQMDVDNTRANRMMVLRPLVERTLQNNPEELARTRADLAAHGIDLNYSDLGNTYDAPRAAPRAKPVITGVEEIFD